MEVGDIIHCSIFDLLLRLSHLYNISIGKPKPLLMSPSGDDASIVDGSTLKFVLEGGLLGEVELVAGVEPGD